MKISGFTIARNADKLYFPIRESIMSILPLVDEYIIAIDKGDEDDNTLRIIEQINSPKIKIHHRKWSEESFNESRILAEESNYALSQCSGDWCFYLQADEVIHENDHPVIMESCEQFYNDQGIDGLLFKYHHFWGDYNHHLPYHGWYNNEIRIIRNRRNIVSIKDAQSFRKANGSKLRVKPLNAYVFHYGWVRPPHLMQSKKRVHDGLHVGVEKANEAYNQKEKCYDYGPLGRIPHFQGTHPHIMRQRIKVLDWKDLLNYSRSWIPKRPLNKHEKWRYRAISWIENNLLGQRQIFGYKNWKL